MGTMHIVGACCFQGELDEEKVNKLLWYMFWLVFMLLGVFVGYVLESWFCGIFITLFIIVIGICAILWNKETKKENKDELD